MLSIIIININSSPLSLSCLLKWRSEEEQFMAIRVYREERRKIERISFCMFYVLLQSLVCHKNLLFVVYLSQIYFMHFFSLFSVSCRCRKRRKFLLSMNINNNNFYALFVKFLLLVLCRQLSGEHILLHATIFLCKESREKIVKRQEEENFSWKS